MYLSRIAPRTDVSSQQLAMQLCHQDSYLEHQQLWRLFGDNPDAERDFLFRRESHNNWPRFYLLSRRRPSDATGLWHIEPKDFRPQLKPGDRLAFSLRANPVISRKDTNGNRSKRHDLVMDIKTRIGWKDLPAPERPPVAEIWQQAGEEWLQPRLEKSGAKLDTLVADGYTLHRDKKNSTGQTIRYSSVDLRGTLTVTDPAPFILILNQGIGPAKSLGCGLLLVRRI